MSDLAAGLLTIGVLLAVLAIVHVPLGDYMARVYTSDNHWRVERLIYRAVGVEPDTEQRWRTYAISVVVFSVAGIALLYAILVAQAHLPLSLGYPGMSPDLAFNTSISFVTNTNWQNYAGESTLGYTAQMGGLAVQNFVSAAVGMAVAVALVRGFARSRTDRIGNFWVDLVRGIVRILLPIAFIAAIVLLASGVIQNFNDPTTVHTLSGGTQTIPGGPVASQEAVKELGTNGGGFFNANSAHPFENPNAFTNLLEIFLLLLIPSAFPRTFGRMVGDKRQGYALLAAMGALFALVLTVTTWSEVAHAGTAPQAAGAAMEGKEQQFGVWSSTLFGVATTGTSTGAVNSAHDSYTAGGGGGLLFNMLLGEISPGGVGSGLYGILVMAVLTVFVAGLMVGRTPEYLGKRISRQEITLAALYILVMPTAVLVALAFAISMPGPLSSLLNTESHGLTEMMYAYASAGNNNGSAFGGLSGNTPFFNITLALVMLIGRFLPMVLVLALAGRLATGKPVPIGKGTLPTHSPLFISLLVGLILLVTALTFFPALALGPIAEALQ